MTLTDKINQYVQSILPQDYFLIQTRMPKLGQKIKIVVIIDGDKGVDVEVCASVSRQLGAIMEEENWLESAYILEVSSPGAETPLVLIRQYAQHIGRNIKIETSQETEIVGTLTQVCLLDIQEDSFLEVTPKTPKKQKTPSLPIKIIFTDIKKAQIIING